MCIERVHVKSEQRGDLFTGCFVDEEIEETYLAIACLIFEQIDLCQQLHLVDGRCLLGFPGLIVGVVGGNGTGGARFLTDRLVQQRPTLQLDGAHHVVFRIADLLKVRFCHGDKHFVHNIIRLREMYACKHIAIPRKEPPDDGASARSFLKVCSEQRLAIHNDGPIPKTRCPQQCITPVEHLQERAAGVRR